MGARELPASRMRRTICASVLDAPTAVATNRKPPVPLIVPPVTLSPTLLVDRHRLAGEHRFVHCARPRGHPPVDRDPFTRPHDDLIARHHRFGRNIELAAIANDARRLWLQRHERAQRG